MTLSLGIARPIRASVDRLMKTPQIAESCWGYIPPDKFVKPEEEDPSKPLNAEDEVALLLKEDLMKSFETNTTGLNH